jgi:prepilin-type N-terminal cleavage/methylation domain-containing protein
MTKPESRTKPECAPASAVADPNNQVTLTHSGFGFVAKDSPRRDSDFGFRALSFRRPPVPPLWQKSPPPHLTLASSASWRLTRPRAFTVIELVVVCAIIAILSSFLFVAYKHVVTDRRISDTKTAMQSLQALLGNYEQATHFQRPLPIVYANADTTQWNTDMSGLTTTQLIQFWTGGYTGSGEPAASLINAEQLSTTGAYPTQLADTICVMYALESIPENATILANIPTNSKKTIYVSNTSPGPGTTTTTPVTLILDGWGNPILFAPADGIYGVMTSADPNYTNKSYTLGSSITYQPSAPGAIYIYTCINNSPAGTAVAPAHYPPPTKVIPNQTDINWGGLADPNSLRPFWVSGGPDGDISNARGDPNGSNTTAHDDDNIYSFSN